MQWHSAIENLEPYIVKISTPSGSGTGCLVSASHRTPLRGIATAAHVIEAAHNWEQPIRIEHAASGKAIVLRHGSRAIDFDPSSDTAAILFSNTGDTELPLPNEMLSLIERTSIMKRGVRMGWLGFPAVQRNELCFFSGVISASVLDSLDNYFYLVDGVAINGVSGGPAFCLSKESFQLVGLVSAYIPNRATGEVLPGLAVVRDVARFHDIAKRFQSLDDAQEQSQSPASTETEPAPAPASNAGRY